MRMKNGKWRDAKERNFHFKWKSGICIKAFNEHWNTCAKSTLNPEYKRMEKKLCIQCILHTTDQPTIQSSTLLFLFIYSENSHEIGLPTIWKVNGLLWTLMAWSFIYGLEYYNCCRYTKFSNFFSLHMLLALFIVRVFVFVWCSRPLGIPCYLHVTKSRWTIEKQQNPQQNKTQRQTTRLYLDYYYADCTQSLQQIVTNLTKYGINTSRFMLFSGETLYFDET